MKRTMYKSKTSRQKKVADIFDPSQSEWHLARALELLDCDNIDYHRAGEHLYSASLAGLGEAQYKLAILLDADKVSRQKYGTPHAWYQAASTNGVPEAMCALAGAYLCGSGVTADIPRGLDLYMQAASRGSLEAQYRLGVFFKNGSGPNRDLKKATRWLCQAARQGHEQAFVELEQIYLLRLVRLHELDGADRWFIVSIFSEEPSVWVTLGLSYLRGDKVPRVESLAVRWLCKAAERGSAKALFNLAIMRLEGMGLLPDRERGLSLMRAAAAAGYEPAERWLSVNGLEV